jgi:hypothetical protein
VLVVVCVLDEQLVGDLRDQDGLAGVDHLLDRPPRRVATRRLLRHPLLPGVAVHQGQRPQLAVVIDHPDHAPVGERRHGEPGQLDENQLVVERGGKYGAGLGQVAQTAGGDSAVGDVTEQIDRVEHGAGLVLDREGAHERPPDRARAPLVHADQHLRGLLSLQRQPPGQRPARKRLPLLVEELEPLDHRRERRGEEFRRRFEAAKTCTGLVRVDEPAVRSLDGDAVA